MSDPPAPSSTKPAASSTQLQHPDEDYPRLRLCTEIPLRTLDDFLEEAYNNTERGKWRYWLIFVSLGIANSSDASEILSLSYILADATFIRSFLQSKTAGASVLAAVVFLGMLMGGFLVGAAGDDFGRKRTLLAGLSLASSSGMAAALTPGLGFLILCRFVAGVGIGATVPPLFTLCSELAPASQRGFWVTVAASFWMVGSIYVALIAWLLLEREAVMGIASWRMFAAACALPSALGLILILLTVPESPRFLLLNKQHGDAMKAVGFLSTLLGYDERPWTFEEVESQYPSEEEQLELVSEGSPQASPGPTVKSAFQFLHRMIFDFISSARRLYAPQIQQTTISLQMIWFSLSFGSYGLLTWINRIFFAVRLRNVYFNALLFACSNLPGNLLSAYLMDRVRRANLLSASLIGAAASLLLFAWKAAQVPPNEGENNSGSVTDTTVIVFAACSFQAFTVAAWNAVDVLSSELFPTLVRSTGMGVCSGTGRIAAMLAAMINGVLVDVPAILLTVAAVTLAIGAAAPLFLPDDVTGRPVEDNIPGEQSRPSQSHRIARDNYQLVNGGSTYQKIARPDHHHIV